MSDPHDDLYSTVDGAFGRQPDPLLIEHVRYLPAGGRALDLGVGQGRHALFLAGQGFVVDGVDPSEVSVRTVRELVRDRGLPIECHHGGFADLPAGAGPYDVVMVFGLLQILMWPEIELLTSRLRGWLAPGGLVFVTAFSVDDDTFEPWSARQRIGRNSFRDAAGAVRTFLETGELLTLFGGYEPLCCREVLGPEHRHGDGPVERHAKAEGIFRR